jgi:hypothetical protein
VKIEAAGVRRIRITLTRQDMRSFGLTEKTLLQGEGETANALFSLLQAGERFGFPCETEKLLAEVYPLSEEGCVLYFTGLQAPARYRIKEKAIEPRLFLFRDVDALCSACRALRQGKPQRIGSSTLYRLGPEKYILAVCALGGDKAHFFCLLQEFGEYMGRGRLLEGIIREHALPLREKDAIEALSYF